MADTVDAEVVGKFHVVPGAFATLGKKESEAPRSRLKGDVRQSGRLGDPSGTIIHTRGHLNPALPGEPNNSGSKAKVWLA